MNRRRMTRYRLEVASAAVSLVLLVVTLISREWIELVFGVDPDGGSGALEWGITLGFLCATVVFSLLARRDRRALLAGT